MCSSDLLSLLYKSTPDQVRMIMVDPKMLELSVYEGIPHLLTPVVTDMKEAANALRWCVGEMERRYKLMSKLGVRNLAGFNKLVKEAEDKGEPIRDPLFVLERPLEEGEEFPVLTTLPSIVIVIDELADMMMIVGKKVEELEYDSEGNLTEDFVSVSKSISKYDSDGNKVEESYYDSDGNLTEDFFGISKTTFKYNSDGNEIEKSEYDSNGLFRWKYISKYDSNGNKVEVSRYDLNGSFRSKYISKYDSNGNRVEDSRYDSDGSLLGIKYIYKYDSKGNKIEESMYNSDGSLWSKHIYKYDSNGNKVEESRYDTEGNLYEHLDRKSVV